MNDDDKTPGILPILLAAVLMWLVGRGTPAPEPGPTPPDNKPAQIAAKAGRDFLLTIADKLDAYSVPETEQKAFEEIGNIIAEARKQAFLPMAAHDEDGEWDREEYQVRVKQYAAGFREAVK